MRHYVALSVVGTERLAESGYFRADIAQEQLIKESSIPYSIVHATQFFEFVKSIAAAATDGNTVRLAPVYHPADGGRRRRQGCSQDRDRQRRRTASWRLPVLSSFVSTSSFDKASAHSLDPREVVADPGARYFGAVLDMHTLVPADSARLGEIRFQEWLGQQVVQQR